MNEETSIDLDDLLDTTLDDLEDLPEFKPFIPGAHKVQATFSQDKVNNKPVVKLDFTYLELVEAADPDTPEEEHPKAGDTSNTIFMLDNEYGRGNLKKCAGYFQEAMGLSTIRDVVDNVKDIECILVSGVRKDKDNPDKKYLDVKEIGML